MQTYKCKQCGTLFDEYPSNRRQYCSLECGGLARRTTRPKCKGCGKRVRLMRNTYCSRTCKNKELGFQPRGISSYSGLYLKLQKLYPNPEPCRDCGKMGKHRHHPDYNKPFEIVWLCSACHRREHQLGHNGKGGTKVRTKKIRIHTQSIKRGKEYGMRGIRRSYE